MAKIILVGNYKGGVGKTTAVINLADAFSSKGFKVLTVDLDPQSYCRKSRRKIFIRVL